MRFPEVRSHILKNLLLAAQEDNASHKDICNILYNITKDIPETRLDLINILETIFNELSL